MNYFVQREQREYGPYTEGDLRRYLASGHLSPHDPVRREDEQAHRPLSQFVPASAAPALPPGAYAPAYQRPQMANGAPLPPNLHWGLVLLLTIVTCGFFSLIWMLMQAWWLKQLHPANRSIWLLAASFGVTYAASIGLGAFAPLLETVSKDSDLSVPLMFFIAGVAILISLAGLGLFFAAELAMRKEMLTYFNTIENIQLRLNPVLTVLVGLYYLQYHMSRIAEWKKTGTLAP